MYFQGMVRQDNWLVSMVQIFLDLLKTVRMKLTKLLSYLKYNQASCKLYTYDTIPLRLFLQIAEESNLNLLIIKGKMDIDPLTEAYENIIRKNSEVNGGYQYLTYFNHLKSYAKFIAEYMVAKAILLRLAGVIDWPLIMEIRQRGYKIDTTNTLTYTQSISAGLRKVSNLITRATMKRKEIEKFIGGDGPSESFASILANISYSVGYNVDPDITLSGYNEYRRILKLKHAQQSKAAWQK